MDIVVVMSTRDYDCICGHVDHVIHILDRERVTKKDREHALKSLYAIRANLRRDLPSVEHSNF